MRPGVGAHDLAGHGVDELAGPLPQPAGQPGPGVAVGDEADVVAVGLLRHREAPGGGLLAHLRLGRVAQGEEGPGELVGVEHAEHVRLVLGGVHRPVQLTPPRGPLDDARVVAGGDRVEAQRHRPVEQRRELDPLVAPQARVGRAPGRVLRDEVVDDVALEAAGEVPDVERDAEPVRDAAGVTGILEGAAAARRLTQRRGGLRQREVHADDLVTRVEHPGGGDRRVDPARHRGDDPHQSRPPARRARSTTAGRAARNASTSASVEVWPSESRSAPRASRLGQPHRQQHVAGLRHPGLARRPGAALDARGVEQVEQGVALAPGHDEVGVAGQPAGGVAGGPAAAHRDAQAEGEGPLDEPVAQHHDPLRLDVAHRHGLLERDRQRTDAGHVQGAAAHLPLLAAAVGQRHQPWRRAGRAGRPPRAGHRPCGRRRSSGRPRTRRSAPAGARPPARRRCGRARRARGRRAASSATGCTVPTSLLAHMTLTRATSSAAARLSRRSSTATWPQRSGSSQLTEAPCPTRNSTGSSTAWCSMALTTSRVRAGSVALARGVGALDGQVVGLGAAGGEDDLRGAGPEHRGDPLARLLDDGAGGAAGGVQRRRVADPGGLLGEGLDRGRQHRGGRRVVEVGSHGERVYVRVADPAASAARPVGRPARRRLTTSRARPPAARSTPVATNGHGLHSSTQEVDSRRRGADQAGPAAVEPGDVQGRGRQAHEQAGNARPAQ